MNESFHDPVHEDLHVEAAVVHPQLVQVGVQHQIWLVIIFDCHLLTLVFVDQLKIVWVWVLVMLKVEECVPHDWNCSQVKIV